MNDADKATGEGIPPTSGQTPPPGGFRKPAPPPPDTAAAPTDPGATWANIRIVRPAAGMLKPQSPPKPPAAPPPPPEPPPPPGISPDRLRLRPAQAQGQAAPPEIAGVAPVIPLKPVAPPPPLYPPPPSRPAPPEPYSEPSAPAPASRTPPPAQQAENAAPVGRPPRTPQTMTVKKVTVEIPPDIGTPPPPKQAKAAQQEEQGDLVRRLVIVLFVFCAQALLEFLPVFLQSRQPGETLNGRHLLIACIFPVAISALVLVGHRVTIALAAFFILFQIACAAFFAFDPAFIQELAPGRPMPHVLQAAGAGAIFIAAFLLVTGGGAARWTLVYLFAAAGIAAAMPPAQKFLDEEVLGTGKTAAAATPGGQSTAPAQAGTTAAPAEEQRTFTTVSTKLFTLSLPSHWRQLPARPTAAPGEICQFGHDKFPQASLVVGWSLTETPTPAEEARRQLDAMKAANPGAAGIMSGIAGRNDRMKIYLPAASDVLYAVVVCKGNTSYILTFRATQEVVNACRSDLDVIFESFMPR